VTGAQQVWLAYDFQAHLWAADWIAAIGQALGAAFTFGAVWVALRAGRRAERLRDEDQADRDSAQARMVTVQLSRAPYRASTPASEFLPDQEHLVVISAASGPAWCRGEASRSPGGPRVLCGPGRAVWGPSEPERRYKTPTETGRPFGGRLRRSVGRLELFWLARGLTWTGDTAEHPLHLTRRARGGTP
jgi:hypothetical protein